MVENKKSDIDLTKDFIRDYELFSNEIKKVIVGQDEIIKQLLISIFCNGHCIIEGVPGLAKTLLVRTISKSLGLEFKRIQFTPDLMPSDIVGTEVLDENKDFKFIKGPLFGNLILADEINRTPPKTQSALLEAMEERSITNAGNKYILEKPFFVLATQNPIEQEGTYPLPEAQLDRFMFNIILDYPSIEEEILVVKNDQNNSLLKVNPILSGTEIINYQKIVSKLPVPDNVVRYAVNLVSSTRPKLKMNEFVTNYVDWGAGPRASKNIILASKCHALINGKYSPDIEDVKAVSKPILRHRVIKNYKAESEGISIDQIIEKIL